MEQSRLNTHGGALLVRVHDRRVGISVWGNKVVWDRQEQWPAKRLVKILGTLIH